MAAVVMLSLWAPGWDGIAVLDAGVNLGLRKQGFVNDVCMIRKARQLAFLLWGFIRGCAWMVRPGRSRSAASGSGVRWR